MGGREVVGGVPGPSLSGSRGAFFLLSETSGHAPHLGRGPGCSFLLRRGWLFCLLGWDLPGKVAGSWAGAAHLLARSCQHERGPSTFSELDPGHPEVNTRDTVPPLQIFTREHDLSPSQQGSELPVLGGGSAWPGHLFGARVTRDSGHGDIGSSLWWFPGTLGRPHLSQLLRRSLPWIKDPPGWRSAEDMPWLWRRAWGWV